MLNKVDGIKKLSKKELEESRKIVLASIKEEFKKGQELLEGNNKTPNKKVDGIFSSLKQLKNNNKQQVQKKEEEEKRKREKEQLILKKQEEERRTKERERLKEEKEKQRKIQRKKKIKEQLRKEKEAFRQIQLEAREKSREKEHLARMQKKKKAAKKREALIKKYKSKIKSLFKYLHLRTFKTTKKVIYFCLFFLVVILILYFIFVSVILKFDIDNVLSRFVADFIPVPALATSDGIIEYYKYKDLKDNFKNTEGETDIDKKIKRHDR